MMKQLRESIGLFSADVRTTIKNHKTVRQGIDHFLAEIGLSQFASKFKAQELTDVRTLKLLTDDDLKDLQIDTIGAKRKLLSAIKNLQVPEKSLSSTQVPVQAVSGPCRSMHPLSHLLPQDTMNDADERYSANTDADVKRARETIVLLFYFLDRPYEAEAGECSSSRHETQQHCRAQPGQEHNRFSLHAAGYLGVKSIKLLPFNPRFDTRVAYVNFVEGDFDRFPSSISSTFGRFRLISRPSLQWHGAKVLCAVVFLASMTLL
eukprot:767594-Hanusia_phi.AAC.20